MTYSERFEPRLFGVGGRQLPVWSCIGKVSFDTIRDARSDTSVNIKPEKKTN